MYLLTYKVNKGGEMMTKRKVDGQGEFAFSYGKLGKDSVRLAMCKAQLGVEFEDKKGFSSSLQATKGKALTPAGKKLSKMVCLGAIACGAYKGKAKIVLAKGSTGQDRIDYHVQLLDPKADAIKWENITPVGSLSA